MSTLYNIVRAATLVWYKVLEFYFKKSMHILENYEYLKIE